MQTGAKLEPLAEGAPRYGPLELTDKERAVVRCVAQGLKNRDVAKQLRTTEHVIKNYLRVIYDKLGLWNRTELAIWFLKDGGQL